MDLLNIKPHEITEGLLGKKVLVYGKPGTWKTTFASQFPKPLLLATETGYTFIKGVKAVDITSWYAFTDVIEQLKKPEVKEAYDTIVIDTIGLLSSMCVKFICSKHAVTELSGVAWGGGWKDYKETMSSALNSIAQLGYGIVFISHSKETNDEETGAITSATPGTDNQTLQIVNALVDFMFFVMKEEEENGNVNVYAYSNTGGAVLSKSRIPLTPRIKFTFDDIDRAIANAVVEKGLDTVKVVTIAEEEKISLDDLVKTIKANGGALVEKGLSEFVTATLTPLGVTLDEVTNVHYDSLEAMNHTFKLELAKFE